MNIAVYPGSFDPITYGHLDILKRSSKLFDIIIVAVADNSSKKNFLFTKTERIDLIKQTTENLQNVEIDAFEGLLINYCLKKKAKTIIRGLRAVSDFEYEYAVSLVNKDLSDQIETIFLMSSKDYSFVSSSIVKEIASYGKESLHVPQAVNEKLIKKYKNLI